MCVWANKPSADRRGRLSNREQLAGKVPGLHVLLNRCSDWHANEPELCRLCWHLDDRKTPSPPFFTLTINRSLMCKLFCTSEGNWAVTTVLLKIWCIYCIWNIFCSTKVEIHNTSWFNKIKSWGGIAQLNQNKHILQFTLHYYRNIIAVVDRSDKFLILNSVTSAILHTRTTTTTVLTVL